MLGVRLILLHPEVAYRSCVDCLKYVYLDDGSRQQRHGVDLLREPGTRTPCWKCPKIPASTLPMGHRDRRPEAAVEMSWKNHRAYRHYLACKATGRFPTDAIVARNAAIIRQVEDAVSEARSQGRIDGLILAMLRKLT